MTPAGSQRPGPGRNETWVLRPASSSDGLELLERLLAAPAITERAAGRRAEDVLERRVVRAAVGAAERLRLELDDRRLARLAWSRRREAGLAELLAALRSDPVGRPRVVRDHLDVGLAAELGDLRGHLRAHHLEGRAAEEGRRELDAHLPVLDLDVAHDAQVDDRDHRDLGIGHLGERFPDASLGQHTSSLRIQEPGFGTGAPTYLKSSRANSS